MIRTIRKRCACIALLFLGVAGSACGNDTVPPATSMQVVPTAADLDVAGLEQFIDGVMAASAGSQQVSGAVLSIVKDGKVLFAKGYGHADLAHGTPVDPRTSMFRIGSVTKLFTWTAVMQLVEQGRLDLDADVNSYLKTFQLPNTYPAPITLRHLLTHTAGFEEGFLGYVIVTDPKDAQRPMAEVLANHIPARVRPPGTMPSYSNYGAALAGLIVEQVSGLPYNGYVQRHIFDSLRMTHSTFEQQPQLSAAVIGYARENGDYVTPPYEYIGGFRPCGGASASALDMARFMLAYLQGGEHEGGRILRAETIQQMRAPQFQLDERFVGIPLGSYLWKKNGSMPTGMAAI
jgi:CubicO group peptidase (beta-lactamase class C family)